MCVVYRNLQSWPPVTKRAVPGSEICVNNMDVVEMTWKLSLPPIATGTVWFRAWTLSTCEASIANRDYTTFQEVREEIDLTRKIN